MRHASPASPLSADAELRINADWQPETCATLCRPPMAADARAEAARLAVALPSVPTREADYHLIRCLHICSSIMKAMFCASKI